MDATWLVELPVCWLGVYAFFKSVGATCKFQVLEEWHEASSILRTDSFGVACEPLCCAIFCAVQLNWYVYMFLYVKKKNCSDYAEKYRVQLYII
jgi:hypothetical protein